MKKIVSGLLCTLILVFAACSDGNQSPVGTARGMFGALNKGDQAAWTRGFCVSYLAGLTFVNTGMASGITYTEKNRGGNTAEVEVTGTLGINSTGQPGEIAWVLQLQKRGSGWCVSSIRNGGFSPESPAQVVESRRNPKDSIEL